MAAEEFRKRHPLGANRSATPQSALNALHEAKELAERLSRSLGVFECPPAVLGAALAIMVGRFAASFDVSSREAFYETFMLAARESEWDVWPRPDKSARRLN